MEKILKNKNILISGVGKGLGLDMLYRCIDHGAYVYGFTRSKNDLKKINKNYLAKSKLFVGDATNDNFLKKLFLYFKKNKIYLNGLINNAGQRQRKSFIDFKKKDIEQILKVNFLSTFSLTQLFVKNSNNNEKSIVNVGSIVGDKPFSDLVGYASSKSAISGFTKSLALELQC
jgi:3-oxoacyl-[acyl-carrier protein] reductase